MHAVENSSRFSRDWSLCALVAAVSVTTAVLLVQFPWVWLGAAAVVAVLAQFRSPLSGLAVVIFTCGLLNYSPFESGAFSRIYPGDLAIGVFVLAWALSNFSRRQLFLPTTLNRPLLAMAVLAPASMLLSRFHPDPEVTYAYPHSDVSWTTAQASELMLLVATLCLPFAVAAGIRRWKDIENVVMMIGLVAAIGTLITVGALLFGFGGTYAILGATRAYWGQAWDSSMEITALCLPFLFAAVLFGRRSVSRYRLTCVLFGLCLIGLVLTFSRETWLLGCCGLLMVGAVWLRARVNPAVSLILVVTGSVAVVFSGIIGLVSSFYNPDQVYGLERIVYYMTALQLFTTHPLLGVGAGNYQFFDRSYEGNAAGGIAHNQFLTAAAETGLVGLLVLLWLVLGLLKMRKELRSSVALFDDPQNWIRIGGAAFLVVWIAECFFQEAFFATAAAGGGMHVLTLIVFPWIFLGLLLAICNLPRDAGVDRTSADAQY